MPLVHTSVVGDGSIRDHEFAHLSGVRSNIQQQIDGLVSNNTPPAWGSGKVWKHCKGDPAANANLLTHNTPMKVRRFQVQTQSHFSDAPYPTDNGMSANALVTDRLFTAPRTGVYVVHIDAVIRLENEPENDDGFVLDAVFNLEHANTSVLNRRFTKILDSPPRGVRSRTTDRCTLAIAPLWLQCSRAHSWILKSHLMAEVSSMRIPISS